jgi:hypothetical protein
MFNGQRGSGPAPEPDPAPFGNPADDKALELIRAIERGEAHPTVVSPEAKALAAKAPAKRKPGRPRKTGAK